MRSPALLRIAGRRGAAARGSADRGAASGAARMHGISAAVDSRRLGLPLAQELSAYLRTWTRGAGACPDGGDDVHRAAARRR